MTWYLFIMAVGSALLAIACGVWVAVGLIKELAGKSASQEKVKREK